MRTRSIAERLLSLASAARRRLRVSLGLLLLLALLTSVAFEFLYARNERRLAARLGAVEKLGDVYFKDLDGYDYVDGSNADAVCRHCWIDAVYLYVEDANDQSLDSLVSLKRMSIVKFNGSRFVERHIRRVEELEYFEELHANGTGITDDNLARLSTRSDLTMLCLNDTEVTDACIPSLIAMPSLKRLVIHKTYITPEGYAKLKEALPDCEIDYAPRRSLASNVERERMKPLPRTEYALLVRTHFADEEAWTDLRRRIEEPQTAEGFRPYLDYLSDPQYDGAGPNLLVNLSPSDSTFLLIADDATFYSQERLLLVVNLFGDPSLAGDPYFAKRGDNFRAVPEAVWSVENNLSLGNLGFEEFVAALDAEGVFRGFEEP